MLAGPLNNPYQLQNMGNSLSTIDASYNPKSTGDAAYNHNDINIANGVRLISRMGGDYVEVQKHKNFIINLQQQKIGEYEQTINGLNAKLESKDVEIKNQEDTIISLQQQLEAALKHKNTVIGQERETRRLSIALTTEYEEKVKVLENKVDEKEQNLQKKEEETEKLIADLDEKNEEILIWESMNEVCKDEQEELKTEIEQLSRDLEVYATKYKKCNAKLQAATNDKPKKEELNEAEKDGSGESGWYGVSVTSEQAR